MDLCGLASLLSKRDLVAPGGLTQIVERREDVFPALPVVSPPHHPGARSGSALTSVPPPLASNSTRTRVSRPWVASDIHVCSKQPRALQARETTVVGPALPLPLDLGMPEPVHLRVHDQAGRLEPALHVGRIGPGADALGSGLELAGGGDGLGHLSPPFPGMPSRASSFSFQNRS